MSSHDAPAADEHYEADYTADEPDAESAAVGGASTSKSLVASSKSQQRRYSMDEEEDELPLTADSGINSIHTSYILHIRSLQKTSSALTKKVEYLQALQSEHTKIKLVKKLQRLLREKQMMVDDLAEMVMSGGIMTPEALSTHLQQLIERGALDQPNPASTKKELAESRKNEANLRAELSRAKKIIKSMEAAAQAGGSGGSGDGAANSGALSARSQAAARDATAQSEAERSSHSQLRAEFLALSSAHTSLQSELHSLTLSLGEHKALISSVTAENRTLRGYLTQWELSEERRILAEQNVLLLQESAARTIQEREGVFQELREFKSKLLGLAQAKVRAEAQAAHQVASARRAEQVAREQAAALARQLELLKTDLVASGEVVAWHRGQNVLHLSTAAQTDNNASDKAQTEEIQRLQSLVANLQSKNSLLLQKEGEELPQHQVSAYSLLAENASLRRTIEVLEDHVGDLGGKTDAAMESAEKSSKVSTQSVAELAVLQRALQAMASDLGSLQNAHRTQADQLAHATQVKIPRMRAQRHNLALACQRQNATILQLTRQIEEAAANGGHIPAESRSSRRDSRKFNAASAASAVDLSQPQASSSSHKSSSSSSATTAQRPASAHVSSTAAASSTAAKPASSGSNGSNTQSTSSLRSPTKSSSTAALSPAAAIAASSVNDDPFSSFAAASESAATAPAAAATADPFALPVVEDDWTDPSGTWTRYATEDGQAYYYYNNHTGDSVWIDPLLGPPTDSSSDPFNPTPLPTTATATAAAEATSSSAAQHSLQSAEDIRNSDLELTPLQSQRYDGDLPQLSTRAHAAPTYSSAPSAMDDAYGDEFPPDEEPAPAPAARPSQQPTIEEAAAEEEEF